MPRKENKNRVYAKTKEYITKFKNIFICEIKDLPTNIVQKIRHELLNLKQTETLGGKTTVMQKAIKDLIESKVKLPKTLSVEKLNIIKDSMPNTQILMIYTNKDITDVTPIVNKYQIEKQAKTGQLSPIEVIIPAGPTGMDSSQIEYFQALKIPTKVVKSQLEITANTKILTVGQKITLSEINLMKKFNIKPYKHNLQIKKLLLNGNIYGPEILKITDDYMKKKLEEGIHNIIGFSLGISVPIEATISSFITNAFKNVAAFSIATNCLCEYTKNTGAPAKVEKPEPKVEEKKKPEPKKEEEDDDDVDIGGLF